MFNLFKKTAKKTNTKSNSLSNAHQNLRDTDAEFRKLDDYNRKGDKQIDRINKAKAKFEGTNNAELIKVYDDIIMKEGMCFNGPSHLMFYLNLLYKENVIDKAWEISNHYTIKYPDLFFNVKEFQVKVLKKEKKYKEAIFHQVLAIIYHNQQYNLLMTDKVDKKIDILLKRSKLEDRKVDIVSIINKQTKSKGLDVIRIRDELRAITQE